MVVVINLEINVLFHFSKGIFSLIPPGNINLGPLALSSLELLYWQLIIWRSDFQKLYAPKDELHVLYLVFLHALMSLEWKNKKWEDRVWISVSLWHIEPETGSDKLKSMELGHTSHIKKIFILLVEN